MSSGFPQRPERRPFGSRAAMAGPGPGAGDPDEQYDFLFKLVLVGDASVGKTCVVQRFKTGAFSERQGSTIGVDFTMKTLEIQGKRVKVGGPAWGRRAGVAWPSLAAAQPGLLRAPGVDRGPWKALPQRGRPQAAASAPDCPEDSGKSLSIPPFPSSCRSRPRPWGLGQVQSSERRPWVVRVCVSWG